MPSLAATAGHRARSVASALRLAVIAWLAVVATALPAGSPGYKPGVVLVQFKPAPAAQAMAAAQLSSPLQGVSLQRLVGQLHTLSIVRPTPGVASTAAAGGSVDGTAGSSAGPRLVSVDGVSYSSVPPEALMLMAITDGTSPVDKAAQLSQLAEVEYAEPVYYRKLSAVPNDPFYPAKATTSGLWFLDRIAAPAAWDITTGSSSVPVCVIDTGARRTHQDLAANIKGGWNRGEDANGNLPKPGSPAYYNFSDDAGHGTHTTGSVGAVGNNGLGGTGVAWQAALWHCKVGSVPDSNGDVWLSTDGIIDCYSLCASKGAKVVSASYGGPDFMMSEMTAIDAIATTSGGLLFAAAGNEAVDNDKVPSYPASYVTPSNNVISVAASLASDELAAFSNWGRITVHIATPGINIRSTVPASDSSYDYSTGTSMATPITAGAAALLFAANPNASWADVRAALLGSVDQVPALAGKVTSGGRLNVQRALATLLGLPLPNAAPNYIFSVATGIQYNLLLGPFEKQQTLTTPAAANCMASCRTTPWCWFATHSGTTCQLVDASVLLDSAVPMPGATSGYKLPVTSSPGGTRTPPGGSTPLGIRLPPPARSPPARPPPARPPPPRLQQPRPPPLCPPPPRPSPPPPRPSPLPPKRQPPSAQGRAPARPVASPPPRGGGQHLSDRRSLKGAQRRQQRGNPVCCRPYCNKQGGPPFT